MPVHLGLWELCYALCLYICLSSSLFLIVHSDGLWYVALPSTAKSPMKHRSKTFMITSTRFCLCLWSAVISTSCMLAVNHAFTFIRVLDPVLDKVLTILSKGNAGWVHFTGQHCGCGLQPLDFWWLLAEGMGERALVRQSIPSFVYHLTIWTN